MTIRDSIIPLWIKIFYTVFLLILVPVYWAVYGPSNFLWGSDIALFITFIALWREDRLLASMMSVGVLLPELAWGIDFIAHLVAGHDVFGLNATSYMFTNDKSLFVRSLSLFHIFLPIVLIYLLFRLGYDRRALLAQTLLAWVILPVSYLVSDPTRNINWVYGFGSESQTSLPAPLFVLLLMLGFPLLIYLPSHWLLLAIFRKPTNS